MSSPFVATIRLLMNSGKWQIKDTRIPSCRIGKVAWWVVTLPELRAKKIMAQLTRLLTFFSKVPMWQVPMYPYNPCILMFRNIDCSPMIDWKGTSKNSPLHTLLLFCQKSRCCRLSKGNWSRSSSFQRLPFTTPGLVFPRKYGLNGQ